LDEAGSGIPELLRLRTYIVDHSHDKLIAMGKALAAFYGNIIPAPNTVIGVQSLALPGQLIEFEATALVKS